MSGSEQGGDIAIATGNSTMGSTGDVRIVTGDASNDSSGEITVCSGGAANGQSGDVYVGTGDGKAAGNVLLRAGTGTERSGLIIIANLPTVDPGVVGALWMSGRDEILMVSTGTPNAG